ncbi:MAG: hypothetical protein HYY64_19995 [Candidatus Rokubacteria bacterium]|nr:hypothetical protein [Candidatus Rokubacteria bacterium]
MPELTRRYVVMSLATEAPFDLRDADGPFVLKPWKDPAALRALETYRDHCYPELARDLDAWILAIKAGPAVRGGVGRRNEPFAKATLPAAAPRPRPGTKPKPKPKAKTARKKGKRR